MRNTKGLTQLEKVEKHLNERGKITTVEAFGLYGITRLSAKIYDLRKKFGESFVHSKRKSGINSSYVEYQSDDYFKRTQGSLHAAV